MKKKETRQERTKKENDVFDEALARIGAEFDAKKSQKRHLMYMSRIQRAIEIMPIKKKKQLQDWLDRHVLKLMQQQARLGVRRKHCYCEEWFYNPDKYMQHVATCKEYAKHAKPPKPSK